MKQIVFKHRNVVHLAVFTYWHNMFTKCGINPEDKEYSCGDGRYFKTMTKCKKCFKNKE